MSNTLMIYARFLTQDGKPLPEEDQNKKAIIPGQIQLINYSNSEEQSFNIGSQSSGAGAGKIMFNPVAITKSVGINTPTLFFMMAAGQLFKRIDFYFYSPSNIERLPNQQIFQVTLGLAGIRTMERSSNDDGLVERITFDYGQQVLTYFYYDAMGKLSKTITNGWDKVTNNQPDRSLLDPKV